MNGLPSTLGGLLRYLAERIPHRAGTRESVRRGPHPARLSFSAPQPPSRRLRAYLHATHGHEIDSLSGGEFLPPLYPGIWETAGLLDLLRVGGFPFPARGLIHRGSERLFIRPMPAREPVRMELKIERSHAVKGGTLVIVRAIIGNRAGRVCTEDRLEYLLRGIDRPGHSPPSRELADPAPVVPPDGWKSLAEWRIESNAGRRYARASGDYNPIHLFRSTARPLGFSRAILHGCCVEAMVAHAIIARRLAGEPAALRRLRIRFSRPIELPGEIRCEVTERPGGGWFRVVAPRDSRSYAEGEWAGSRAGGSQG